MFTEEEMARFHGVLQHTEEFVEMGCGCTNPRYGDKPGKLRLYINGKVEIDCICRDDCTQVNASPVEFAKHAGRTNTHTNWKTQIWVFGENGLKIGLRKTGLLKYHTETFHRPLRQFIHRDKFKVCSHCHKERRFSLRDKKACKIYHHARLNPNWKCSDMPNQSLRCNEGEERECRRRVGGCPRMSRCRGCEQCVCVGCDMCRFEDCGCQTCTDFIFNN